MTAPASPSYLDFFILEAGEYVEQLDGLLLRATEAGPDGEAWQKAARALRGSATMAKLPMFAELASIVELVGRAVRQGSLPWDAALRGAMTAAVDDLKLLVRAARAWSPAHDQSAMKRIGELSQYVASGIPAAGMPNIAASKTFFATESTSIAAGMELIATRPDDGGGAAEVLRRVRALRGVAGANEIPALAEVLEAAETAIRPLELGVARLTDEQIGLLRTGADLVRVIASGIPSGSSVTPATEQYKAFLAALDAVLADVRSADRVVPIATLFFNDKGPHVVSAAANPPTTPAQRFRMEVVSLGEHLHQVIHQARTAADAIQQEHAKGELGRALRAIRATAASFEQLAVAQTVEAYLERTGDLNAAALDAISSFAATISPPPPVMPSAEDVGLRMTHVRNAVGNLGASAPASSSPVPARPAPPAAPVSAPVATSVPAATHARVFAAVQAAPPPAVPAAGAAAAPVAALDSTIAAFDALASERLAEPAPVADDVVPVDALFYSGRAALDRAIELRDSLRRAGGPPAPDVLEEIYDLLDLAKVG